MSSTIITVLITTYNYGRFIEECIDSVLSQEYPPDKVDIVLVDDGSTDDTPERVKKYGAKIRYFRQENRGQAAALNVGFANARGEIISLLDADDYFFPWKLARVAEIFQGDTSLGMFYHPFLQFDMETKERGVSQFPLISGSPYENPEKFLWYAGPGTCASFRRKFLDRLLPIPEEIRMLADGYLGSMIVFVAPILAVPECLAAYRFHGKNAYHADESQMSIEARKNRLRLFQTEFDAMRRWLAANGYTKKQLPVRIFLNRWNLLLQGEGFLIKRPSRARFLRYVLLENYATSQIETWKLTVFNYLSAFSALVFGYNKAERMYAWRGRTMSIAQAVYRRLFGARAKQSSSG